jgi:hypothetical protein
MDINLKELIKEIKKNKYESIPDFIIKEELEKHLHKTYKKKQLIKLVRSKLHKIYGTFQIKKKKKLQALIEDPEKIIETTISTKERLPIYETLYKDIFYITGKPKTILDLASGLNPASYKFLKIKPKYIAIDINQEDISFLNNFFKKHKINGKAMLMKIDKNTLSKLPKSDMVFLFKALDTLEPKKGHKFAELLIKSLKTKYIIVSFPTKTISQKQMRHPYRGWIERMLKRLGFSFKTLIYPNEIFYIIKK